MMKLLEVIECTCGARFAACVDGMQDEEWVANRLAYILGGCRAYFTVAGFEMESCDCDKRAQKDKGPD